MYKTPAKTQSIRLHRASTRKMHTPETFAAARRLRFSDSKGVPVTEEKQTPWGEPDIPRMAAVFKTMHTFDVPPVGGSREAATHWKTKVDLFLRSSRYVRDILDGRRQHPWINHAKLQTFGESQEANYKFSAAKTAATLEWVARTNQDLAVELDELLHFGDVVSWASLNEAVYTTLYNTLANNQRYLISGVERHDGITARERIFEALSDADSSDQATIYRYAQKIRQQQITAGPDPLGTYFGKIKSFWNSTAMAPGQHPAVPEADVVGTVFDKLVKYHPQMRLAVHHIQRTARETANPQMLQLRAVQNSIMHTWRTELTDAEKQHLTTANRTVAAAVLPGKLPDRDSTGLIAPKNRSHPKADRYLNYGRGPVNFFLPGGCKNCRSATNHITRGCHIVKRKQKLQQLGGSMPAGEQWCNLHANAWHFSSECRKRKRQHQTRNTLVAAVTKQVQQHINQQYFRSPITDVGTSGHGETMPSITPSKKIHIPQLAAIVNALSPEERAELGKQLH